MYGKKLYFLTTKKVTKGTRWMPRLLEAKKDVVSCEKLRGDAKQSLIFRYPNGATRYQEVVSSSNGGKLSELKHLSS